MNAIKSLLAVSVLATAGAAHAAIIDTYSVTLTGVTSGLAKGSLTGSGTATFDSSGVLTIDYTALNNQPSAGGTFTTTNHTVLNGTIAGNLFTTTSGTTTPTACTAGTTSCPAQLGVGTPVTLNTTNGGLFLQAFNISSGGINTSTTKQYGGLLTNKLTYTFVNTTAPAVPVPAAAWLFGSGLLGLASTARRRKA